MNELDFELDTKAIGDDGSIEGLAVGYGNVDHGGDQVMPGAITGSLAGRKSLPMLLYHDQRRPAGVWNSWQETSDGLLVKGRFAMNSPSGKEAHGLTKDGAIGGLSMGFKTLKQRMEAKTRQLIEVSLHEISLVTIPMNDRTRVTSVKDIGDLRDRLAAGDRLTAREWEGLLRKSFDLSNAEAERAIRINLKVGQGEPGTEDPAMRSFWEAMRNAPIIDETGEA